MAEKKQIDFLMDDLRTIDDFFRNHGYCVLEDHFQDKQSNPDEYLSELEKKFVHGFKIQKSHHPGLPVLWYNMVLAYSASGKYDSANRFFIDVFIGSEAGDLGYQYRIRIRKWRDPHSKVEGAAECYDRFFAIPPIPRDQKPVEMMLSELQKEI